MPTEYNGTDKHFLEGRLDLEASKAVPSETEWEENDEILWDLLSVYADGEATPEEASLVETMLQSNAACARDFAFLKTASQVTQSFAEVEPPFSLRETIAASTTQRPTLARRLAGVWADLRGVFSAPLARYAAPAGAAVMVLTGYIFWPRQADTTQLGVPPVSAPPIITQNTLTPSGIQSNKTIITSKNIAVAEPGTKLKTDIVDAGNGVFANLPAAPARSEKASLPEGGMPAFALAVKQSEANLARTSAAVRRTPTDSNRLIVPQPAVRSEEKTLVVSSGAFSPRPGMDMLVQRSQPIKAARPTEEEPSLGSSDVRTTDTTPVAAAPPSDAIAEPIARVEVASLTTPRTFHLRSNRVLVPDSRRFLTTSDVRRERDASMQGYDRSTVLAIQRNEVASTNIGRF